MSSNSAERPLSQPLEDRIIKKSMLPRWWLTRTLYVFGIGLLLVLGLLRYVGVFGGNVRVVDEGRLYRSALLTGRNLDRVLQADHIRSVINLWGRLPQDAAWRSETATCARAGVAHIDIRLSAERLPPPEELRMLLTALDTVARPILIHCQGGADRSGLAATLYLTIYRGVPLDEAEARQLTWRYGHLSFGHAHPMDDFFTLYRQTGGGLSLREWIMRRYPQVYRMPRAGKRFGIDRSGR